MKYKFDPVYNLFRMNKVLPAGLVFPFDFGFIPNTKGDDGDPFDALVISEFTSFPGCILDCRLVGGIQVEQGDGKTRIRNDRFIAIPEQSRVFENVISIEDIPTTVVTEVESFFLTYTKAQGKEIHLLGNITASQAVALVNRQ